ncbi:MAG: hypothetical protein SGI96_18430 [Bacteroidota bacterium]|nr:hypothetical protein [Bacteroidota bacterium]
MKKNKTLFITSLDDSHSDYIINILNKTGKGKNVVRLNTEFFIENCQTCFTDEDFEINIQDSKKNITKNEIFSVWFRRPKEFLYNTNDEKETAFIHKQSTSLLRGIYFSTHDSAKWINPLPSLHRARIKLQQLSLAKQIGFNVPKTIATNSPVKAQEFINNVEQVSTKSLDEPSFQADKFVYPLFNRKLKKDFIEQHLQNISYCPTLLQEYIEKKSDIRVVVIGKAIYAFEIHSQENELSIEDFRGVAPAQLRHDLIKLPPLLENQIFTYMNHQKLIYSSLDFVRSKNDRYFFIENNPNGQWLWLELQTGVKISESFIKELLP